MGMKKRCDVMCLEQSLKRGKNAYPGVLSTGNSMETTIFLELDNLSDCLVLNGLQFRSVSLASGHSITLLDKLIRTKQRADVLSSERRAPLGSRHFLLRFLWYFLEEGEEGKFVCYVFFSPAAI